MKLVKALAALLLVTCAVFARAADGDPPTVVGRLNFVAGPVSFAPAQADEDWVAASLNRPITTGDRLWTDTGGRAEMHVGSLAIRMGSQTSLDVLNLDDRALQLRLAQGSANVRVRRATGGGPVEIATPGGAVVLARPGAYRVNVDAQGYSTSVSVRGGGQAEIFAANGSFVVRDGEQATLAGSREDVAVASAPDEFDRWAGERDRREDRVAATRYVPAEMTGYEDLDEYGTWRTVPEYGTVWQPTSVPAGWAPYRYGHWVWVAPWGWTWVDDAPWGFAPSHYGRWIWLGRSWAWAPGRIVARPVYAPALVAFIGGPNFSVSIEAGSAPAVGWVPLGWHEPYRPWYRASHAHVRDVNITNVSNVTNINVNNVRYVNRSAPSGVTVVSRENFAAARPVQRAALRVSPRTVAAAPVTAGSPAATPSTASLAQARPGARPPAGIERREAVAISPPPARERLVARDGSEKGRRPEVANDSERPRVRVIDRRERVNPAQAETQRAADRQEKAVPPASASSRERSPEKVEARSGQAAERRAPSPPADVTARPTFDRSGRIQEAPQRENRAAQAQNERRAARQEERGGPQREHAEQEGQRQTDRGQQAQRQAEARREEEQRNAQQRLSVQQERQRQPAEEQNVERQRALEERGQAQRQKQAQQQAQEQARQREQTQHAEQQARQRAQEQAVRQQERQAQQRAQLEARQREQAQHAEQQSRQRAQQQAEQRAQQQAEQRARQQAEHQAQQRAQQQARQHEQAQRAEQHAQQEAKQQAQEQPRQQRRESHEKGGRERARAEKSEKG